MRSSQWGVRGLASSVFRTLVNTEGVGVAIENVAVGACQEGV